MKLTSYSSFRFYIGLKESLWRNKEAVNLYLYHLVSDYVFGNRKFGGNAQSITKTRWIHHTSFLWDYEVKTMAYLKLPARAPEYRLVMLMTSPNIYFFLNSFDTFILVLVSSMYMDSKHNLW